MSELTLGFKRETTIVEKLASSKLFWLLFAAMSFSYPLYKSMNRELPPPLPIISKVPEFNFTNEFKAPFGSKNLNGKAYIASFFFTSCPTTCPGLMENLKVVQKRVRGLGTKIAIVSFSVDPENDTPDVLHKYAREHHSNPYVWNFVTGPKQELRNLLVNGYRVPMGNEPIPVEKVLDREEITLFDIVHTEKLVLVDRNSNIRGYYSTDKNGINKLMIDVGLMVNRNL